MNKETITIQAPPTIMYICPTTGDVLDYGTHVNSGGVCPACKYVRVHPNADKNCTVDTHAIPATVLKVNNGDADVVLRPWEIDRLVNEYKNDEVNIVCDFEPFWDAAFGGGDTDLTEVIANIHIKQNELEGTFMASSRRITTISTRLTELEKNLGSFIGIIDRVKSLGAFCRKQWFAITLSVLFGVYVWYNGGFANAFS